MWCKWATTDPPHTPHCSHHPVRVLTVFMAPPANQSSVLPSSRPIRGQYPPPLLAPGAVSAGQGGCFDSDVILPFSAVLCYSRHSRLTFQTLAAPGVLIIQAHAASHQAGHCCKCHTFIFSNFFSCPGCIFGNFLFQPNSKLQIDWQFRKSPVLMGK